LAIPNRARIVHTATISPGIHLRELARTLGLSLNTVRYNVESLSKSGLIICEKSGGFSRIYPAGTAQNDMTVYSLLRNTSARKVLSAMSLGSRLTNKEICEKTGLAKSTVTETIQKFLESHVVQLELSDSGVRVGLQDPLHVAKLLGDIEWATDATVVDNFIDLWDF
jgi:predicted transcriptional regulator